MNKQEMIGFELPGYEEYISDFSMNDNSDSRQQYEEYIEELYQEIISENE